MRRSILHSSLAAALCAAASVAALVAPAAALADPAASDGSRPLPAAQAAARGRGRARSRARPGAPVRLPFQLTLTARAESRWWERNETPDGCYRLVTDFAGTETWSVRTRQPARVWLIELDDERTIRLLYEDGEEGVVVGGSWERKVSGGYERHPTPSGNCHNLKYSEGPHPDAGDCRLVLPEQVAELQLGFTSAYGIFNEPTNLPADPFDDCPSWGPEGLGPPEYLGDLGSTRMSARALLRLKAGASITLRHRKTARRSTLHPFTREGWFSWEARLTRLKDAKPAR